MRYSARISIHAPHARSDGYTRELYSESEEISIHAPHARSDDDRERRQDAQRISIHAPHARSDDRLARQSCNIGLFQSTLLMRGATSWSPRRQSRRYFNPRSSCEERQPMVAPRGVERYISIHAPHARSDILNVTPLPGRYISIHAPHARSDICPGLLIRLAPISIHAPHARSDHCRPHGDTRGNYFNPRSSCEERLARCRQDAARQVISIHAPHARSDMRSRQSAVRQGGFQSTLLMRGATFMPSLMVLYIVTFQSTLLMRGATSMTASQTTSAAFQSTLLMRGATDASVKNSNDKKFQSTLLMRGAKCHFQALICLTSS